MTIPASQARFWYLAGVVSRSKQELARAIEELNKALALSVKAHGEAAWTRSMCCESWARLTVKPGATTRVADLADALRRVKPSTSAGAKDLLAVEAHLSIALVRAGHYSGIVKRLRELLVRCDRDLGRRTINVHPFWLARGSRIAT